MIGQEIDDKIDEVFSNLTDYQLSLNSLPYARNVSPSLFSNDLGITFSVDEYKDERGNYGFRLIASIVSDDDSVWRKVRNYGYDTDSERDWYIVIDNIK